MANISSLKLSATLDAITKELADYEITDAGIAHFVSLVGADRVLAALDRLLPAHVNKPTAARGKPSVAYSNNYVVRLIAGLRCSCGRELKASDINIERFGGALVCGNCHTDVARVEPR